ncbi:ATP synthase delta chain like [Actinidia chinensis var. chinensis]|uniref:ATP synthase delta chain like n=1 Tax=Actinidia chinensis var. chinensis TaxID=1590841 RepID=A0A2R6PHC0_ACTCC|nr:ATP synthase delta chain like [Actinidia chinensis var. chinensis]
MISKPLLIEENHILPLMNGEGLWKAVSDASIEINKMGKGLETIAKIEEVEQEECECCGLKEECTQEYITKIKNSHSGKWVCGLCAAAVKERLIKEPRTAMEVAVSTQRIFCQEFNNSRINPNLSLTCAMRKIARRSFENRRTSEGSSTSKIARSISCFPNIDS